MRTENEENYGVDDRDFQTGESSVREPQGDEYTSYVDQYENNSTDPDDPQEEETIVNEEDSITNDQDNLDKEFLDALQDDNAEENYNNQNSTDTGDPNADDGANLDVDDLYENEASDETDLADNDLNDLEGDHLNNPDLDKEEQKIRNRDSFKID